MLQSTTKISVNSETEVKILDRPHPVLWRIIHGIHFLIGGVTFVIGSVMYFPNVYNNNSRALTIGGWFFTVGSFFFLLADLQEWWYFRVGCICDCRYRKQLERQSDRHFAFPANTWFGRYERAEPGLNCIASIIGSALYLAGSILFIPNLEAHVVVGEWLFIVGSAFIFVSQAWKVYRSACSNSNDPKDRRFRFSNMFSDVPALGANTFPGFGGLFYFIGTILFLPDLDQTDADANRAAGLFVGGGVSFTLGGLFLLYYYFLKKH